MPASQILAKRILGKPLNSQQFKPRPRLLAEGDIDPGGVQLDDSLDDSSPNSQASTVNNIYPSPYAYDEMGRGTDSSVGGDSAISSDRPAPLTGPSKGSDPSTSINVPFFGGSKPDMSYDRTSPGQPPMGGGMAPGTASPTNPTRPRVGIPIPGYNTSGGAFEGGGATGQGSMGQGPGSGGPISRRFEDVAANPAAYGADPKSSFLRRLGGAAIDIAGTWGSMFGVPRNLTHHLAEDVRYGADAAHQKENYYQNLPLLQEAAQMEEKNRQLDEQTQYRILQQNNLNAYRDSINQTRQENADVRKDQAVDQAYERQPGFIPLPPLAPGIPTSTPISSTPPPTPANVGPVPSATTAAPATAPPPLMSIPQMTGGMTPQQQRRPGYVPAYIPAGTSTPAIEGQRPDPMAGKGLMATPPTLISEGYPAQMTSQEIVSAMTASLARDNKPTPNLNDVQAYINAAGGDEAKGLAKYHADKMAERSVNNFSVGTPGSGGVIDKLTRYTKGNRQYIDGTGVTGKNLLQLQAASPQGVPVLNKEGVGTIQANGAVNSTLDDMMNQIQSKLPKDPSGRITAGPSNKLSQYFQTDKDLAAFSSWQLNAIGMIRAMGMNRLNQQELTKAIDAMPKITDTVQTAQQKIQNVKKIFQNKEDELFKGMGPNSQQGGADPFGIR